MKKLLTLLFSFLYLNIFACSCCYFTTTFCGKIDDNLNSKVALLEVQKLGTGEYYQQIMTAKVVHDLFDNIPLDTITVFGSDGGNCNGNFSFGEGDTILMQIYEYYDFYVEEVIKIDTVYQNGGCGVTFLRYEANHLMGNIMPEVNKIPYDSFIENINQCQASPNFFSIAGQIISWKEPNKGIQINGMEINGYPVNQIDTGGYYSFKYTELTENLQHKPIEPYANERMLRGVTMSDIVKIQQHILGIEPFKTPYQFIAADVNNSKTITTLDLIQIRKVILGLQKDFTNNSSWRFTAKDYDFQTAFPLTEDFDAKISFNVCSPYSSSVNLIAIKVGDVDGDAFVKVD